MLEAFVNGVSTRKVDRLVEQLGIEGMSKDHVSALCRALDEKVSAFRASSKASTRTCGGTPAVDAGGVTNKSRNNASTTAPTVPIATATVAQVSMLI